MSQSLTLEQADKILWFLNKVNASYPLTFAEMKRVRPLFYIAEMHGINFGLQFQWYVVGPYNKALNDFLLHLVHFTQEHPLHEWYKGK